MDLLRELTRMGRKAERIVRQGKAAVRAVEHGAEGAAELARSMGAAAATIREVSRAADKVLCDAERLVGSHREDPRVEVRPVAPKPARAARPKTPATEEVVDATVEDEAPARRR